MCVIHIWYIYIYIYDIPGYQCYTINTPLLINNTSTLIFKENGFICYEKKQY